MGNLERAQRAFEDAVRVLFDLEEQMQAAPQSRAAFYDRWVTARLHVWVARERLRQAQQDVEQGV